MFNSKRKLCHKNPSRPAVTAQIINSSSLTKNDYFLDPQLAGVFGSWS